MATHAEPVAAAATKPCPQCGTAMPVIDGYQTWCDACDYDILAPGQDEPNNTFERYRYRLGKRFGESLLAEMLAQAKPKPGVSIEVALALLLSAAILVIPIIATVLAALLLKYQYDYGTGVSFLCFGLPVLLLSIGFLWQARPRLGSAPKKSLTREQAPQLYQLVDTITSTMRSAPVTTITLTPLFNACYSRYGLRRKVHLDIGLPIIYATSPQELVALIAHEMAHGINGDANRGLLITSGLNTIYSLYDAVTPSEEMGHGLIEVLMRLFFLPVRLLSRALLELLHLLTFRSSQRAEYYADLLAATVSGTDASVGLLRKTELGAKFISMAETTWARMKIYRDENVFQKFRAHTNMLPAREIERYARIQARTHSSLDATHPPTDHRVRYLRAHSASKPQLTLSQHDYDAIIGELMPFEKTLQDELMGA
jgi:hypothetical protein